MGYDDTEAGQLERQRLDRAGIFGHSEGIREAGNLVMERAVEEFKRGCHSEIAETLRAIATMLLERADQHRQTMPTDIRVR